MALADIIAELNHSAGIVCDGSAERIGGGSSNEVFRLPSSKGPLLVKVNTANRVDMFEAEAAGIEALRQAQAVSVPVVHACGKTEHRAFLVLQWIEFAPNRRKAEARLGRELAKQHAQSSETFGWHAENTIGMTPQLNTPRADWTDFLGEFRLAYQLELAARNGLDRDCCADVERLLDRLDEFFEIHQPRPSLLHGDLWSGNWGATDDGRPYIFDPAVYFGDREADLAMTRLFDGFSQEFYRAYEEVWPLEPGWQQRVVLYNLYHLLNHFNLFGHAYVGQLRASLSQLAG